MMNLEDAKKTLLELKEILDQAKIKFWLTCGTLLGAVRNNNFIPYDSDIDLILPVGNWNSEILLKLEIANFRPVVRRGAVKMRKRKIPLHFYLYYYYSPADVFVNPRKCLDPRWREIPRNLLETETFIEFLGEKFRIPYKSEELLASMYGSSWRIPQLKNGLWKEKRTFQPIAPDKLNKWILKHPKEAIRGCG